MRFFNLDLHASVIADVRHQFGQLGHTIDSWLLSSHAWVFGEKTATPDVVNRETWRGLSPEMCDAFYERYRDELAGYDGFVVTHTPSFALLYERWNKPIIVIASTRYEAPFTGHPARMAWLDGFLHDSPLVFRVANNRFDEWNCERRTDAFWNHIPSLCDYTGAAWTGKHRPTWLHYRDRTYWVGNRDRLRTPHEWQALADFAGVVHENPHNVSTMSMFEQRAMGVPMVCPSAGLMRTLYPFMLGELWWEGVHGRDFPPCGPVESADWLHWPGVTTFDDPDDIPALIESLDLDAQHERTRQGFERDREDALVAWQDILNGVSKCAGRCTASSAN